MKIYSLIILCINFNSIITSAVVRVEKRHSIGDDIVLSPSNIDNDKIVHGSRPIISQQIPTSQYGSLYDNANLEETNSNNNYQPIFQPVGQQLLDQLYPYGYQQIQFSRSRQVPSKEQMTLYQRPKVIIPYHVGGYGIPYPGYNQYPYTLYEPRSQQFV